jgi:tripartite motif-containing protein 71
MSDGQFNKPHSMSSDTDGNVFVIYMNNHRIQKFTSEGQFIAAWGSEGELDSQFLHPHGLDVDSAGNVYTTDAELLNIQKFTNNGEFVTSWGGIDGTGPSEFSWLESVAVDSMGNVYVADMKNHPISYVHVKNEARFSSFAKFTYNGI